jgi:hypothetical protein
MDRATEGREMRKLGAAPEIEIGSVAALTEAGALPAASATGNQLGTDLARGGPVDPGGRVDARPDDRDPRPRAGRDLGARPRSGPAGLRTFGAAPAADPASGSRRERRAG